MPRRASSKQVPYAAAQMFDLVADIERYPEFLPWCRALRVISRDERNGAEIVVADLVVGYRMFSEVFRSRVNLNRELLRIDTDYVRGPMRNMKNRWAFEPCAWPALEARNVGEALEPTARSADSPGAIVHFEVSFSLRNPMLHHAASMVFEEAFAVMADAFIERAAAIYGASEGPGTGPDIQAGLER